MATPRPQAIRRSSSAVFPLELFFDLVFVLALTQCSTLMAADPTPAGIGRGLLALAVLWFAWTAYAWLTSVVDPEADAVRITMFAAMAAMLVVSMCVPGAFGDLALTFTVAYAAVRGIQILLFVLASPDDPDLRRSVVGLAVSTSMAIVLLTAAAFTSGATQAALWAVAIVLDFGGPFLFGSSGWRLVPGHFAERHEAVIIIALGESVVAIGVGAAPATIDAEVIAVAVLGLALAAALWWLHFDVVALVTRRRLESMEQGQRCNALARDAYTFGHLPLVAGIVLTALALKTSMSQVTEPLSVPITAALCGGVAIYLLGQVLFRWRFSRTVNRERLVIAVVLLASIPLATRLAAWAAVVTVTVVTWALVAYETTAWSDTRRLVRQDGGIPSRH